MVQLLLEKGLICPVLQRLQSISLKKKILYPPGKEANAGGVGVNGFEMSQDSTRMQWTREEVDNKLHGIMLNIHKSSQKYGTDSTGYIDYVKGANVSGFVKVADAMIAQGVV